MPAVHSRVGLAEFQNGDPRLIFARFADRPDEVFYLENGTAADLRAWTKQNLECFMPVCDDRRLTTVSRVAGGRRDGFTHMRGAGGHAPMSLFHSQAQQLLVRWARTKYPQLQATLELRTEGGERRADVMITSREPIARLALEVQYSSLTIEEWRLRHESYRSQGIGDVWLLGHNGPLCRLTREGEEVKLGDLHHAILASGQPLFWVNPIEGLVGTARVDAALRRHCRQGCSHGIPGEYWMLPGRDDFQTSLVYDRLDDCRLVKGRFVTPALVEIKTSIADWERLRDQEHEKEGKRREWYRTHAAELDAQRRARLAAQAKRQKEAAARDKARAAQELEQIREWWTKNRHHAEASWSVSELRFGAEEIGQGKVPTILALSHSSDDAIFALPEHWHCVLFEAHVSGRPSGHRFTRKECLRTLQQNNIEVGARSRGVTAIDQFLRELDRMGLVEIHGRSVVVRRDLVPLEAAWTRKKEADTRAEARALIALPEPERPPIANHWATTEIPQDTATSEEAGAVGVLCKRCGLYSRDPVVVRVGYHADAFCDW